MDISRLEEIHPRQSRALPQTSNVTSPAIIVIVVAGCHHL